MTASRRRQKHPSNGTRTSPFEWTPEAVEAAYRRALARRAVRQQDPDGWPRFAVPACYLDLTLATLKQDGPPFPRFRLGPGGAGRQYDV